MRVGTLLEILLLKISSKFYLYSNFINFHSLRQNQTEDQVITLYDSIRNKTYTTTNSEFYNSIDNKMGKMLINMSKVKFEKKKTVTKNNVDLLSKPFCKT